MKYKAGDYLIVNSYSYGKILLKIDRVSKPTCFYIANKINWEPRANNLDIELILPMEYLEKHGISLGNDEKTILALYGPRPRPD